MTIEQNLHVILAHLASFPRDKPATGHDLAEATSLDPHDINDAMRLLVDAELASWFQPMGTAPFDFGRAEITSRGRLELETSQRAELTIFVGSSTAARSQAKAIIKTLRQPGIEFVPWWEAFTPSRTLLEELDSLSGRVHAALLLFSPESETTIRGNKRSIPNLNVLFEFGYFSGRFGREKVGMLKYGEFYLPSDFGGYIHITGSKSFKRGAAVPVGKRTKTEFTRWIEGM